MTPKSSTSEFPTADYYDRLRHSVAHIMADAVLQRYPGTKLGVGPTIENGFYYDFQVDNPFTPDDLIEIEIGLRYDWATCTIQNAGSGGAEGEYYQAG